MSRQYTLLPDDQVVIALWDQLFRDADLTAGRIGCSVAAVRLVLRRHGLTTPRRLERLMQLQQTTERMATAIQLLEARVTVLEQRPVARYIEVDHRRIADGGVGGRASRRRTLADGR